jgi:energy-coupling factor transport system permease protein
MLYAALELGPRALLAAWLVLAVMTVSAGAWLLAMAQFFEALRDAPPERAAAPFLRLAIMANAIAPLALNSGTAELMAALGRPKLPGLVKLPLMVAIRFVPTILSDLAQLREAAVIRLRGRKGLLFWARRPLLGWRVLMRPLLTRLIRSADDLAVAAELKGLRPDTPFSGERAAFGRADKRALAAAVLAAALAAAAEALARGA